MPVEDHAVHPSVVRDRPRAGCYNRQYLLDSYPVEEKQLIDGKFVRVTVTVEHTMSALCRAIGEKVDGRWKPLDECVGCEAPKDVPYIDKSRRMIDNC